MIRIGLQVPQFGPHAGQEAIATFAQTAERLGFDSLWVSDHVVLPTKTAGDYPYQRGGLPVEHLSPFFEAVATLGYLAGITKRVRLGTSVLVAAYRHPVLAAKMLATIDVLSRGRLVLGLGAGWLAEEFELTGAPDFARRGPLLEEIVEVYDRLWEGGTVAFAGDHWNLREMVFDPPPAQRPRPPIWIGGNSTAALRRAARIGDGWHAARLTPPDLATKVGELRELVHEAGREPGAVEPSLTCLLRFGDETVDPLRQRDCVGSPEAVTDLLFRYREAGARTVVLGLDPREPLERRLESLETLAAVVVPALEAG